MIYKDFQNLKLSALGMGAMRLPTVGGDSAVIDEAAVEEMVACATEHGVNYFDTAWGYHGGNSETVMGRILSEYPRDSFFLASKFPGYDLGNMDKAEEIFEKQLEKCRVEHFDFYMLHNVCELNIDAYLDKKHGVFDYFKEQRDAGRVRHLGFSAHGGVGVIRRFLDAYGEHMELCMIQLNYLDWTFQNAEGKVRLLNEYRVPVWVMEPLRGGKLASLPEDGAAKLRALRPDESIPAWAFRFLQTNPNVTVTLTGASDLRQLRENISIFETEKPLGSEELDALLGVADSMVKQIALPCTACRYCVDHCPKQLDIPALIELYNEHCFTTDGGGFGFIAPMVLSTTPEDKRPAACVKCGGCEAVCPQNIRIAEAFADFTAKLNTK